MEQCSCPGRVPVVSQQLVDRLLAERPWSVRMRALTASLSWLTSNPEGLPCRGSMGSFSNEERDQIATEAGNVVGFMPCPFQEGKSCLLEGLGEHYNHREEDGRSNYWFLPTAIVRRLAPDVLKLCIRARSIPEGKSAGLTRNHNLFRNEAQRATNVLGDKADWLMKKARKEAGIA